MTATTVPHHIATPVGAEVVNVDPDVARGWLLTNTHNRNPRAQAIARYAADMAGGDWTWTGDPIRFSTAGVLLDGQHRLHALIAAAVTLPFLVVRGLEPEAQENIDAGVGRKFHDVLSLRGEQYACSLAAVTRLANDWKAGKRRTVSSSVVATHAQLLRTLEAHPELRDAAGPDMRRVATSCGISPAIVGFCWWLFDAIDTEDAECFFRRLGEDTGHEKGEPIYELRRTMAMHRTGARVERVFAIAVTIKAWNAYRAGETVALYRWRPGGANPETFPEPK